MSRPRTPPPKGSAVRFSECGVTMSSGSVSVGCKDLPRGQFVHNSSTGNVVGSRACCVSRYGLRGGQSQLLTPPPVMPATGHPSLEAQTLSQSLTVLDQSSVYLSLCRHHCSEAAGGGPTGTGTAPSGCLLSVQER